MTNEEIPDIDQALHERLCAYVFGELQGAERATFEAELLRSPALRREQARLTATIGLVKRAVPDEGLSAHVRRDIVASARRSRFRFLSGRKLMLVAAAMVVFVGAAVALRYLNGRRSFTAFEVAQAPAARPAATPSTLAERDLADEPPAKVRERALDAQESMRALGYSGDDSEAASPESAERLKDSVAKEEKSSDETLKLLNALGYSGGGGTSAPASLDKTAPPEVAAGEAQEDLYALGVSGATGGTPIEMSKSGGHSGESAPLPDAPRSAGGPAGRGPRRNNPAGASGPTGKKAETGVAQTSLGHPADSGTYRGPGDSRPPSRQQDPSVVLGAKLIIPPLQPGQSTLNGGSAGVFTLTQQQDLQDLLQDKVDFDNNDLDESAAFAVPLVGQNTDSNRKALTQEQISARTAELLARTHVLPGESPADMFFRYWGDSPFVATREQKLSTFAADVDTASYALTRGYLNHGRLPPRAAVRTEEFVNYFKADQPAPTDGKPFALGLELAPSLFAQDTRTEMLRVTVRGKDVADFERKPVALTFIIDVSGSMAEGGRLELVKRALGLLLRELDSGDSVAIVKFSNEASVVSSMIPANRRGELETLIGALAPDGGTSVEAGLRAGYELAVGSLARSAVNRVILCSDGVGNIGETAATPLLAIVKDARAKGIYLNTVGVGMGNHNDEFLEQLADQGDGVCNYVDGDAEAKKVFVDGLAKALQPIARDVKIQVEFDPARVESWRLLGYENRALRAEDFKNDKIDAGEVNAGHQVTALYELVPAASTSGPLATVRLRYKPPFAIDAGKEGERARADAEQALEIERSIDAAAVLPGFAAGSNGYQRAILVAQFAEVLRRSVHARGDDFALLVREARRLEQGIGDPDFTEFVALLGQANPLLDARSKEETPKLQGLLDRLGQLHYEEALRERKQALAAQAGEPEPSADEKAAAEKAAADARAEIERLEAEVRVEIARVNGDPQAGELRGLGYDGGEDPK